MTKNSFRPVLEELHARAIPNSGLLQPPSDIPLVHVLAPRHHPLYGSEAGNYTRSITGATAASYQLAGRITLAGLGNFQMTGWVQGTGASGAGRATGHLILTNAYGSMTVELHSSIRPASSPVPLELVYSISSGTGVYAHTQGYGIAGFSFTPAPAAIGSPMAGTFNLKFS